MEQQEYKVTFIYVKGRWVTVRGKRMLVPASDDFRPYDGIIKAYSDKQAGVIAAKVVEKLCALKPLVTRNVCISKIN